MTALVPARMLLDAARLFDSGQRLGIGLGEGLLGLQTSDLQVTLRQLDGAFIRYAQLFPDKIAGAAVVEVAPLLEAIKAISLVAERNAPIRLEFTRGQVTVSAGTGDGTGVGSGGQAQASATLDAAFEPTSDDADPVVLPANPTYLIDGLSSLGTAYARLTYPEKLRPVVMTGIAGAGAEADERFRYLFIPVRSPGRQ